MGAAVTTVSVVAPAPVELKVGGALCGITTAIGCGTTFLSGQGDQVMGALHQRLTKKTGTSEPEVLEMTRD